MSRRRLLAVPLAILAVVSGAALVTHPKGPACTPRQVAGAWLPDVGCTPGALNDAVTPATLASTICRPGWATKQRKALFPASKSETVKRRQVRQYGAYAGASLRGYELDHLVPISLGGAVTDERNLWPEAPPNPNPKDKVEAAAQIAVCKGRISLGDAQALMAKDWTQLGARLGVKP